MMSEGITNRLADLGGSGGRPGWEAGLGGWAGRPGWEAGLGGRAGRPD